MALFSEIVMKSVDVLNLSFWSEQTKHVEEVLRAEEFRIGLNRLGDEDHDVMWYRRHQEMCSVIRDNKQTNEHVHWTYLRSGGDVVSRDRRQRKKKNSNLIFPPGFV